MKDQIFIIAVLGGLSAVAGLLLAVALAVGLYTAISRAMEARQAYAERRRDLRACQAIDALGTTDTDHH
ncbi:MAG TPA: hypothetical protein VFH77_17370 [Streptomyces sp.]|nr:hypothetical protein [Streptomyces sp.]